MNLQMRMLVLENQILILKALIELLYMVNALQEPYSMNSNSYKKMKTKLYETIEKLEN